jgi:lysophospholipase L1-like esterase
MKHFYLLLALFFLVSWQSFRPFNEAANPSNYLSDIKIELKKEWPKNKTINLVFHGHSVPAGYFKTPTVNTLQSYPYQVLEQLKSLYPLAVINVINTAIGGENSINGEKRFKKDVLNHQPDVIFIDYALNDRGVGLEKSRIAWEKMIKLALRKNIKVILLTPSPDMGVNILDSNSVLNQHAEQVKSLSTKYNVGLIDSYALFKEKEISGEGVINYMSQVNHPNEKGHRLISTEILTYFK